MPAERFEHDRALRSVCQRYLDCGSLSSMLCCGLLCFSVHCAGIPRCWPCRTVAQERMRCMSAWLACCATTLRPSGRVESSCTGCADRASRQCYLECSLWAATNLWVRRPHERCEHCPAEAALPVAVVSVSVVCIGVVLTGPLAALGLWLPWSDVVASNENMFVVMTSWKIGGLGIDRSQQQELCSGEQASSAGGLNLALLRRFDGWRPCQCVLVEVVLLLLALCCRV